MKIPQLKQTYLSKLTYKSNIEDDSHENIQSSFGFDKKKQEIHSPHSGKSGQY